MTVTLEVNQAAAPAAIGAPVRQQNHFATLTLDSIQKLSSGHYIVNGTIDRFKAIVFVNGKSFTYKKFPMITAGQGRQPIADRLPLKMSRDDIEGLAMTVKAKIAEPGHQDEYQGVNQMLIAQVKAFEAQDRKDEANFAEHFKPTGSSRVGAGITLEGSLGAGGRSAIITLGPLANLINYKVPGKPDEEVELTRSQARGVLKALEKLPNQGGASFARARERLLDFAGLRQ